MRMKFNNKKTMVDGVKFDSNKEARVWLQLQAEEAKGTITDLKRQVKFNFTAPSGELIRYDSKRAMSYVADFTFIKGGEFVVMDAKGFKTPEYKIKKSLMKYLNGIIITEV